MKIWIDWIDPKTNILYLWTDLLTTVINLGNAWATLNTYWTVNNQLVTNLNVTDKLFTINKWGAVASGFNSWFEIEENSVITWYFTTNATRDGFSAKAPVSFEFELLASWLTANRIYTLPNLAWTIALTSDIPTVAWVYMPLSWWAFTGKTTQLVSTSDITTNPNYLNEIKLTQTVGSTTPAIRTTAQYTYAELTGATNHYSLFGTNSSSNNNSGQTLTIWTWAYNLSRNQLTGSIYQAYGTDSDIQNLASWSISFAYWSNSQVQNLGVWNIINWYSYYAMTKQTNASWTMTNSYGFFSDLDNAWTITNHYWIHIWTYANTWTVTNSYWVYIDSTIDVWATSKFALYSLSTSPSLLTWDLRLSNAVNMWQSRYFYMAISPTEDTVWDVRFISTYVVTTSKIEFQKCTVANATKWAGTWVAMWDFSL